jgi:hypothetical protein
MLEPALLGISSLYKGLRITAPLLLWKKDNGLVLYIVWFSSNNPSRALSTCPVFVWTFANPLWTGEVPGVKPHGLKEEVAYKRFVQSNKDQGRALKLRNCHSSCFKLLVLLSTQTASCYVSSRFKLRTGKQRASTTDQTQDTLYRSTTTRVT